MNSWIVRQDEKRKKKQRWIKGRKIFKKEVLS